jgi:hypothetical protein
MNLLKQQRWRKEKQVWGGQENLLKLRRATRQLIFFSAKYKHYLDKIAFSQQF